MYALLALDLLVQLIVTVEPRITAVFSGLRTSLGSTTVHTTTTSECSVLKITDQNVEIVKLSNCDHM